MEGSRPKTEPLDDRKLALESQKETSAGMTGSLQIDKS
jgi:hypothetical protein